MRILIAVADPSRRSVIETESRDLGHDCRSVADAPQAWDAFQSDNPDVVISEWALPGATDRRLHELIRTDPRGEYAYLVLVPPDEGGCEIVEALSDGADDYLVQPFSRDDLRACLIGAGRVTSLRRQLARQLTELEQLQEPLQGTSLDGLTRLRNQRTLDTALWALDARVTRYQHSYCLALVHIDHFAAYRTTHDLQQSDEALQAIASALRLCARSGDTVLRYAVGQFLHVLPEQTMDTARMAAERLIAAVQELGIPDARNRLGVITVSVGLAMLDPERSDRVQDVRRHAEHAVSEAIRLGRNRVEAPAMAPASGPST
jgi:diguanylate cyclase (GGDEF)-like protein